MRYVLVGNYGMGNLGDEALREYFLERFPEVRWQVVSAQCSKEALPRFPGGLRSFLSFRFFRTLVALSRADGLIYGGGCLFTDAESPRACFIWFVPAFFATMLRKPFFLTFQGIGPFRTRLGEHLTRWVVEHAAFISVRDQVSFERVNMLKRSTEVIQSFDPSLMVFDEQKYITRSKNLLIFIPRVSTGWSAESKERILALLKRWMRERGSVRIVALHSMDAHERILCRFFASPLGMTPDEPASLRALSALFDGAVCVLTQRYHGAIVALACGVPFIALRQQSGDKLDALAELCSCPSQTMESLSFESIRGMDWERKAEELLPVRQRCAELAKVGEEALRATLKRYTARQWK